MPLGAISEGPLEAHVGLLGNLLGRLEAILGPIGALLGLLWNLLGRLEAILGRLGALLSPFFEDVCSEIAFFGPQEVDESSIF